jgi:AcrR family transcriptional regulator
LAKRSRYHHGSLREALLRSVERIIKKRGVAFVSLREVARDAHVSHSAPAHHFANKAGLLTAFATAGFEKLASVVESEVRAVGAETGPDLLEAIGRAYVRFAIEHPEHFGVMFRSEILDTSSPEFAAAADKSWTLLSSTVKRCAIEGYARGVDVESITAAAWAVAHGLATLWIGGRLPARIEERDPERVAGRVLRTFVDGVLRGK